MKKTLSTTTKALVLALAASTFSFAGPGLADGAAKFVGNIIQSNTPRSDYGTRLPPKMVVSGALSKVPAAATTGVAAMLPTTGQKTMAGISSSMLWFGAPSTRTGFLA